MIKVYIASPYTIGDVAVNVKNQIDAANELIGEGLCPFVPLLCHFLHMANPQPYATWIKYSMEWLRQCDFVLRLEGQSDGADKEVVEALQLGKMVFTSISDLLKYINLNERREHERY